MLFMAAVEENLPALPSHASQSLKKNTHPTQYPEI